MTVPVPAGAGGVDREALRAEYERVRASSAPLLNMPHVVLHLATSVPVVLDALAAAEQRAKEAAAKLSEPCVVCTRPYVEHSPVSSRCRGFIADPLMLKWIRDTEARRIEAEQKRIAAEQRADTAADLVGSMCHWRFDPHDMRAPGDQHDAFHFGDEPGQTGVCPYEAMAAVLRGKSDPRVAALSSRPVQPESGKR